MFPSCLRHPVEQTVQVCFPGAEKDRLIDTWRRHKEIAVVVMRVHAFGKRTSKRMVETSGEIELVFVFWQRWKLVDEFLALQYRGQDILEDLMVFARGLMMVEPRFYFGLTESASDQGINSATRLLELEGRRSVETEKLMWRARCKWEVETLKIKRLRKQTWRLFLLFVLLEFCGLLTLRTWRKNEERIRIYRGNQVWII